MGQETLGGSCKHVEEMKGGVWFIEMGGGTSERCAICMGDGVEIRYVVVHDKSNRR